MKKMTKNKQPFEKMCSRCGTIFVGYGRSQCPVCRRKTANEQRSQSGEAKRILLMKRNDELALDGKRVCAKCHHVRHLTEFSTSQPHRQGKINKICDRCLTRMYENPKRKESGFGGNFWRRKAYTVNTVGRARLAKLKGVKTSSIRMTDLEWECKPQDLAKLFEKQNGKCFYCKCKLKHDWLQVDHVVPLSRGGKNTLDNIVLTCKDCNNLKNTKTGEEFFAFVREYTKRFLVAEASDKERKHKQQ